VKSQLSHDLYPPLKVSKKCNCTLPQINPTL